MVTVEVSGKKVWFPFECPCCRGYPDSEMWIRRTRVGNRRWLRRPSSGIVVPYCRRCIAHVARWNEARTAALATSVAAALACIVVAIIGTLAGTALTLALGAAAVLGVKRWWRHTARAACRPSCTQPHAAI